MKKRHRKKELKKIAVSLYDVQTNPIDAVQKAYSIITAAYQCDSSVRTRLIIQIEHDRVAELFHGVRSLWL
ncbi:hypothetical protein ACYSNU_17720 [Enterococcus sp. LJL120]